MRRFLTVIISFAFLVLTLSMCGPEPNLTYELEVNITPDDNAGSVSPIRGVYDENESVELVATPADDWRFDRWSGDISSTENPYRLTMDGDKNLIANFVSIVEEFKVSIPITDGEYSKTVTLISGGNGNSQAGLDQSDKESPPLAPPGAFFVGSLVGNLNLYTDSRPAASRIVWELQLSRETGRSMTLDNWTVSEELDGSLMLVNDPDVSNPSIDVDIQSESGFTVSDPSIQTLYVVYSAPEPAKMMAGGIELGGIEIETDADERLTNESQNRGFSRTTSQ
jgi:hypothetical protein